MAHFPPQSGQEPPAQRRTALAAILNAPFADLGAAHTTPVLQTSAQPARRGFTGDEIISYIPGLRVYARGLCRNASEADDLVQETLLRAIEKASQYQSDTNLRAWLFTIMRNRFYSNFLKRKREAPAASDCASTVAIPVEGRQLWHVEMTDVKKALATLPVHYRETLILVAVLGESYIRAAEILDCDIGTIKSRLSRARTLLRDRLGAGA